MLCWSFLVHVIVKIFAYLREVLRPRDQRGRETERQRDIERKKERERKRGQFYNKEWANMSF